MRLVFAGTPQAAVPSLEALLASRHSVVAVVTRPDAPAGRGLRVAASPVADRARQGGLEVLQPARPSDPGFLARLAELAPDCCPITAYGALIPAAALSIPAHGWVNLHFSVLPAWRGAAPVQHAILHGDEITGATTFRLVPELDAGPVFGVVTEAVSAKDTAGDLLARLAVAGAELLVATMDGIESGELEARPQPPAGVSLAPKFGRADARVNWKLPALAVDRFIRACTPAPGAWTTLNGATLKLGPVSGPAGEDAATAASATAPGAAAPGATDRGPSVPGGTAPDATSVIGAGEVVVRGRQVLAGTGTTPVALGDVQPEGKRKMPAADWVRGLRGAQMVFD
jgi:methionyl-tRNA formyltransferase